MLDWNVVITVPQQGFKGAQQALKSYGRVARTDYYNVLVMQVEDGRRFIDTLQHDAAAPDSELRNLLSRVVPADVTFRFSSAEEFERNARQAVKTWEGEIAGKRFHVRMHRRGFKGRLSSQEEERALDQLLVQDLAGDCQVGFEDVDLIIAVETVGQRAGLSLWRRQELSRYPLLGLD